MSDEPSLEELKSKLGFGLKFWLTSGEKNIGGSGWSKLLKYLDKKEMGSLTQAAKECGYSYKYAWNILKRIEKRTGKSPVDTGKGGPGGGGWVKLNEWGHYLLGLYKEFDTEIDRIEKQLKKTIHID